MSTSLYEEIQRCAPADMATCNKCAGMSKLSIRGPGMHVSAAHRGVGIGWALAGAWGIGVWATECWGLSECGNSAYSVELCVSAHLSQASPKACRCPIPQGTRRCLSIALLACPGGCGWSGACLWAAQPGPRRSLCGRASPPR